MFKKLVSDDQPENEVYANTILKLKTKKLPNTEKKLIRCRNCGQVGYAGSYPFSTCPATKTCDDCL